MKKVQARIGVLTPEQIEYIHSSTLKLLSITGIRVDSKRARKLFSEAIGKTAEDDRIRIPADLVERAIRTSPPYIDLFDRNGSKAFTLSNHQETGTIYGIGVTNPWYQNPENDRIEPFTRKHLEQATRLVNTLTSYDVVSTPGVIQQAGLKYPEALATLEMLANTTKPLVTLISNPKEFEIMLGLMEHLHGDLSRDPFLIPYFNPVTPLVINEDTSDKMFATIERGLPLIYSSYGMSGATTPITAGGTLVMLNAELLAGLVLSQLIREGTPVILGSLPAVFEMKTLISAYTPQTMLLNLVCSEMMAHYCIPHSGSSGSGTGWGPDVLASGTLWMNHLTSNLGRVSLAPFVGGNFDSLAFSPATVIYSDEVIRQVRLFSQGFSLDAASIDLDNIDQVGPGGNFLMSEQTHKLYLETHGQHNHIWPGYSLDAWRDRGSPKADETLKARTIDMLENLHMPADHDELIEKGEHFLSRSDFHS
ncbi:MAG: trimethylamine methyltransferase family protein [Candidatus Marinimicrobia bacterium]|nr:trimethylamine methyltransferase family protein [Candidatus Neomarinimicrobiota bacterium]